MGRIAEETWGGDQRWKRSPGEVYEQLKAMLEQFRQQHGSDAAEVVEDIFAEIADRLTGFCHADVSWTEQIEPPPAEPSR